MTPSHPLAVISLALALSLPAPTMARAEDALPPIPEAVTSFGAVAHDGWLYVFGGHKGERHEYNAEMVSGSLHRLRLSGGTKWETLPSGEPAQGTPLAAAGNYIYRVGGMAARNHTGETNDLYSKAFVARFDLQRKVWQLMPPLPEARSSHDSVILGNKLYVGGGWQLNGVAGKTKWQTNLLVLDLSDARAEWRALPQPAQRRGLAMAALGAKLYFIGGMDEKSKPTGTVNIFDPASGEWTQGPDLPPGEMKGFGCSAIAQGGRLFVSGYEGKLYRLNSSGAAWELTAHLQHARFFHRLLPLGDRQLVAVGGEGEEAKLNDLEILTPSITPLAAKDQPHQNQ